MRKSDRETDKTSKLKFRVIEFEVEGDDAAIHEGLRSIQAAIARPKGQAAPMKYIAAGSGPVASPASPAAMDDEIESPQTEIPFDAELSRENSEESPKASGTRKPSQPRRVVTPKPLDSLDITSGPMTLEAFLKEKAPDNMQLTCLVFMYWLKQYRKVEAITPSHVYTCYRMLGMSPPKDVYSPLKDMRAKKKWLDKGEGEGEYKLNLLGKTEVERMGTSKAS
ncbi:MAG TPA: hypothetical protein VHE35_03390 [Kofleriaceae bacterium]|nr:hypothetical protein [Kofleriaceae bacterium]